MRKTWDDEDETEETQQASPFESFLDNGWISEVLYTVKSGKEATFYCCKALPHTGENLLGVKVYRARQNRNFKNGAMYMENRLGTSTTKRVGRALKNKSAFGREAEFGMWINHEYETMQALYSIGANIPRPITMGDGALLMEYIGDENGAAPVLNNVELEQHEVIPLFNFMMDNIRLWLKNNWVHGDLSPYNILYWNGSLTVIDFPQAIDPRFNSNAYMLLQRDIDNVCRYFARYNLQNDSTQITDRLWRLFTRSHL